MVFIGGKDVSGWLRALAAHSAAQGLWAASLWQLANYLIPVATFPYLARVLGLNGFGILGLGTAIIAYALLLTDWGFSLSGTQAIAQSHGDRSAINRIMWSIIVAKAILGTVCIVAIVIISVFVGPILRAVLIVSLLNIVASVFTMDWALRGAEAMSSFATTSIVGRVAVVPLYFILVRTPDDVAQAALVAALGALATAILTLRSTIRMGLFAAPSCTRREIWLQVAEGWHVFLSTVAISVYTNLVTVALAVVSGTAQVGLFSGADRLRRPIQALMSPIVLVFFPRMGALGKSDRTAAEMLAKNLLLIQGGCALALTLGLVVFAPLAVYLLLGAAFIDAVPVLRLQACLIFLVGVSNVLGLMIMLPFGMKKQFMHAIFAGAAVGAVSVVPLCYAFGACGAAASTVLAEAAVTLWMFVHLARQFSWLSLRNGHGRA